MREFLKKVEEYSDSYFLYILCLNVFFFRANNKALFKRTTLNFVQLFNYIMFCMYNKFITYFLNSILISIIIWIDFLSLFKKKKTLYKKTANKKQAKLFLENRLIIYVDNLRTNIFTSLNIFNEKIFLTSLNIFLKNSLDQIERRTPSCAQAT